MLKIKFLVLPESVYPPLVKSYFLFLQYLLSCFSCCLKIITVIIFMISIIITNTTPYIHFLHD